MPLSGPPPAPPAVQQALDRVAQAWAGLWNFIQSELGTAASQVQQRASDLQRLG